MASEYEWSASANRWRKIETGRFVSERTLTSWRNQARAALEDEATDLMQRLTDGKISIQLWEREMQEVLRNAHISDYLLARGGRHSLTAADRAIIGAQLDAQYRHLRGFTRTLIEGKLSEEAAKARARMYPRSGNTSFNMGRESAWSLNLPGHPGQGTDCLSNCRCVWQITTRGNKTIASWRTSSGDSCDTCVDRGRRWAELIFE